MVWGFTFGDRYGEFGDGFIEAREMCTLHDVLDKRPSGRSIETPRLNQ
jgi:predicted HNH restriction endonuclease